MYVVTGCICDHNLEQSTNKYISDFLIESDIFLIIQQQYNNIMSQLLQFNNLIYLAAFIYAVYSVFKYLSKTMNLKQLLIQNGLNLSIVLSILITSYNSSNAIIIYMILTPIVIIAYLVYFIKTDLKK